MWTCKRKTRRPALSDWELAERRERMCHARWLVGHGAAVSVAAAECGVSSEALGRWARRAGVVA